MDTTGKRLKRLREGKSLSQADVAKIIGIDRTTYAKYEADKSRPVRYLNALAELYGVSYDYILCSEKQGYYTDPEAAEMANRLKNQPGMRILFDAAKDVSAEDLMAIADIVRRFRKND